MKEGMNKGMEKMIKAIEVNTKELKKTREESKKQWNVFAERTAAYREK